MKKIQVNKLRKRENKQEMSVNSQMLMYIYFVSDELALFFSVGDKR